MQLRKLNVHDFRQFERHQDKPVSIITRGFFRKRNQDETPQRTVPPGQYIEKGFPVLSAGPTPKVDTATWNFTLQYQEEELGKWNWDDLMALPQTDTHTDIHCVTKWSKLDTDWKGVTIDDFLAAANIDQPPADYVMAWCDGGYTTNLPTADIIDGKAMLAHTFDGQPLEPAHGGPVRLLVPHLYLWKSAKWIRGLRFMNSDAPGFWEAYGYHMYGDPWREQRYHYD